MLYPNVIKKYLFVTLSLLATSVLGSEMTLVSVNSKGIHGNGEGFESSISANGRYVAFLSYASNLVEGDTNKVSDVFVHDRQTKQTTRVSALVVYRLLF